MDFRVVPHVGVGPVLLGMSRMDAHRVMPVPPKPFRKTVDSEDTDSFYDGFHVYYAGRHPRVDYIELCRGCAFRVLYGSLDVFATEAEALVSRIARDGADDNHDPELGCSYIFPSLDLSLWRPLMPEDSDDIDGRCFSTIGIGITGYYSHPK